jgi:hypothetical protein
VGQNCVELSVHSPLSLWPSTSACMPRYACVSIVSISICTQYIYLLDLWVKVVPVPVEVTHLPSFVLYAQVGGVEVSVGPLVALLH